MIDRSSLRSQEGHCLVREDQQDSGFCDHGDAPCHRSSFSRSWTFHRRHVRTTFLRLKMNPWCSFMIQRTRTFCFHSPLRDLFPIPALSISSIPKLDGLIEKSYSVKERRNPFGSRDVIFSFQWVSDLEKKKPVTSIWAQSLMNLTNEGITCSGRGKVLTCDFCVEVLVDDSLVALWKSEGRRQWPLLIGS